MAKWTAMTVQREEVVNDVLTAWSSLFFFCLFCFYCRWLLFVFFSFSANCLTVVILQSLFVFCFFFSGNLWSLQKSEMTKSHGFGTKSTKIVNFKTKKLLLYIYIYTFFLIHFLQFSFVIQQIFSNIWNFMTNSHWIDTRDDRNLYFGFPF